MIRTFRHKGLRRLFERGDTFGVRPDMVPRLRTLLTALDRAESLVELDLPGARLHPLRGAREGFWSVRVTANFRIVFQFEDGDAWFVDLVDYH